ncbi:hypothetical protein Hanom_Chr16g01440681 [Helianthus anomalus]
MRHNASNRSQCPISRLKAASTSHSTRLSRASHLHFDAAKPDASAYFLDWMRRRLTYPVSFATCQSTTGGRIKWWMPCSKEA